MSIHFPTIHFPNTYIPVNNPIRKRWSYEQNCRYNDLYTKYMLSKSNMTESFQEYCFNHDSADESRKVLRVVCNLKPESDRLEPFSFNM